MVYPSLFLLLLFSALYQSFITQIAPGGPVPRTLLRSVPVNGPRGLGTSVPESQLTGPLGLSPVVLPWREIHTCVCISEIALGSDAPVSSPDGQPSAGPGLCPGPWNGLTPVLSHPAGAATTSVVAGSTVLPQSRVLPPGLHLASHTLKLN